MGMSDAEILETLGRAGSVLRGHFILSSGLHSDTYVQCARLFEQPSLAEPICLELAQRCKPLGAQVVVGPAYGGILLAYEVARHLGVRALFAERVDGKFTLRRGFQIGPDERVLVTEDVMTTGGSAREVADLCRTLRGSVVGIASIIDRRERVDDASLFGLIRFDAKAYSPDVCPTCQRGIPAVKPGSRGQA